jgi:hypothetical protein
MERIETELARQDRELEDAIEKMEHACRRSGRRAVALGALEALLLGRKEPTTLPAAAFFGMGMRV